jgi:glycosyltransferase involved in cell wall biosynthesis
MTITDYPLVSIVTPVYNGQTYLEECIESVLSQTYPHWEYLIVDNRSTDRTGEIAERYAKKDSRVRVHHNEVFLDIIGNHNHAFSLISPDSKYCKVVSADDFIFPDCLTRMVELAEAHPSVGIVGSYQVTGYQDDWSVRCTGLPYWRSVVNGKEMCRLHLLARLNVFGAPTANLYRCDLIRNSDAFFPNPRAEADISACIQHLRNTDFGFVHQVLSYERCHGDRISTTSRSLDAYVTSRISDLLAYGADYLTVDEQNKRLAELLDEYYIYMAIAAVNFRERNYWRFQKSRLDEFGFSLDRIKLGKAICAKLLDLVLTPKDTFRKLSRRWGGRVPRPLEPIFEKDEVNVGAADSMALKG